MTKQIVTNYKFGVLYQRAGQTEEDQVLEWMYVRSALTRGGNVVV